MKEGGQETLSRNYSVPAIINEKETERVEKKKIIKETPSVPELDKEQTKKALLELGPDADEETIGTGFFV
jgi:hypothetical protein